MTLNAGVWLAVPASIAVIFCSSIRAQEAVFDDAGFSPEFDIVALEEYETKDSVLDDMTLKITQELYAQINDHRVISADGQVFEKNEEIENNRTKFLLKYQNPFAPGWALQGSAQAKLYWAHDYEYETNNDRVREEIRLNELFVQRSIGRHSFKLGRQTIVWGEVVGNSVLDVINIFEFRDASVIEIEDARLNQLMLRWDLFSDNRRLSSFVNLYPDFNPDPVPGSPTTVALTFDRQSPERPTFEVGTQFQWFGERSDLAVMAAYLYENRRRYEADPDGMSAARALTNDYGLLGISANRALGKLLLKLDLAYSRRVFAPTQSSLVKRDLLGSSLGFEYAISNRQNISFSVRAQTYLEGSKGLPDDDRLVDDDVFGTWLMRYSNRLYNDDLVIGSTMNGTLDGDSTLLSAMATYAVDDHWSVMGQVIATRATRDSPRFFLDGDLRVGTNISYSF